MPDLTIVDMVRAYLTAYHFDGLCNPEKKCGCVIDDLVPCGNPGECYAAYTRDGGLYLSPPAEQLIAKVGHQRLVEHKWHGGQPTPTEIVRAYMIEHGHPGFEGYDLDGPPCYCSLESFSTCCLWGTCGLLPPDPTASAEKTPDSLQRTSGETGEGHA